MSDLIDREEAIKAVKFYETFYDPYPRVIEALEKLPSVQSELANNSPKLDKEIGECNDCIKYGGDWECDRVHCHKGDAISRQQAIDAIYKEWDGTSYDGDGYHIASECERVLDELPSVYSRKGKWIPVDSYSAFGGDEATWMAHGNPVAFYYCSECKEQAYAGEDGESLITEYCPNCGADMRGGQDD